MKPIAIIIAIILIVIILAAWWMLSTPKSPLTQFQLHEKKAMVGNNSATFTGLTAEQCAQKCLDSTTFQCKSFDHNTTNSNCFLSDKNIATGTISGSNGREVWNYYERL